jgi:hypothetical protein
MPLLLRLLKKTGVYILFIAGATLAAVLYGALHDQISYTLAPEYYTRFKFRQFGLSWGAEHPRAAAAWVGVLATWWVGTGCALLLGLLGFIFREPAQMRRALVRAALWVLAGAIAGGIIGYASGCHWVTADTITGYARWVPPAVTDPVAFVRVGFLHNGSYLGGFAGLIAGAIYLVVARIKAGRRTSGSGLDDGRLSGQTPG